MFREHQIKTYSPGVGVVGSNSSILLNRQNAAQEEEGLDSYHTLNPARPRLICHPGSQPQVFVSQLSSEKACRTCRIRTCERGPRSVLETDSFDHFDNVLFVMMLSMTISAKNFALCYFSHNSFFTPTLRDCLTNSDLLFVGSLMMEFQTRPKVFRTTSTFQCFLVCPKPTFELSGTNPLSFTR